MDIWKLRHEWLTGTSNASCMPNALTNRFSRTLTPGSPYVLIGLVRVLSSDLHEHQYHFRFADHRLVAWSNQRSRNPLRYWVHLTLRSRYKLPAHLGHPKALARSQRIADKTIQYLPLIPCHRYGWKPHLPNATPQHLSDE